MDLSLDQLFAAAAAAERLAARRLLSLARAHHIAVAATTHKDNQRPWADYQRALTDLAS